MREARSIWQVPSNRTSVWMRWWHTGMSWSCDHVQTCLFVCFRPQVHRCNREEVSHGFCPDLKTTPLKLLHLITDNYIKPSVWTKTYDQFHPFISPRFDFSAENQQKTTRIEKRSSLILFKDCHLLIVVILDLSHKQSAKKCTLQFHAILRPVWAIMN